MNQERRIEYLTGPAVAEYLQNGDAAAILPAGPTEPHGHHLPLGCDALIALATATLAARLADAVVLPPFAYTWPGATGRLPGSLGLGAELTQRVIAALLETAYAQGFCRLAVVCAHGPDVLTVTAAARSAAERVGSPIAVHHAVPGRGTTDREHALAEAALARDEVDRGRGETSRLLAALRVLGLPADLVDADALGRGPIRGPALPAALGTALRSNGAGFFYTDLAQHIPTPAPDAVSVEDGLAYLEATAGAIAESLAALRTLHASS